MLTDPFGRNITYLRISVTDRCNLRCVYCMPPAGITWQTSQNILRYEEIVQVVEAAASLGIRAVRLTGGEPLVRKDLVDLVRMINRIPGIEDISLTTNGLLLETLAGPLAEAGLKRINVSLDTLDEEKFNRLTRGGSLAKVWRGLEAADAAGLRPVKINAVALKGINDDELVTLARLTVSRPWHVRFIELMPIKNQESWGPGFPPPSECYLSIQEIHNILVPLNLAPVEKEEGKGPAQEFRTSGALGTVGIISALGEAFCEGCNRLRLTADGYLRPCLMNDGEVYIRDAIRKGHDLRPLLIQAAANKPKAHRLGEQIVPEGRCMTQIGG